MVADDYTHRNAVHNWEILFLNKLGKCHCSIASISLYESYARWQRTNKVFRIEENDEEIRSYRFFGTMSKKWIPLSSLIYFHDSEAVFLIFGSEIHVGGFCTWGVQCCRSFEENKSVERKCLESTANNTETVFQ